MIPLSIIAIILIPYVPIFIKDRKVKKSLTEKDKLLNKLHK